MLLTSPGKLRAITALLLLAPGTPMLFQGQEFAASSPFLFFADHRLANSPSRFARAGRVSCAIPQPCDARDAGAFADPGDPATFERCKLDHSERETHREIYDLHRDLLKLRREEPVFRAQKRHGVDGAVLSSEAFLLRYFRGAGRRSAVAGESRAWICIWIPRRSRCSLLPMIPNGSLSGRAKIPSTEASERRRSIPRRIGEFPATPPFSLKPNPTKHD